MVELELLSHVTCRCQKAITNVKRIVATLDTRVRGLLSASLVVVGATNESSEHSNEPAVMEFNKCLLQAPVLFQVPSRTMNDLRYELRRGRPIIYGAMETDGYFFRNGTINNESTNLSKRER